MIFEDVNMCKSNIYQLSNRRYYILINDIIRKNLEVYNKDVIFLHLIITKENKLGLLLSKEDNLKEFNIIYSKGEKIIKNNKRSKKYKIALNSTISDLLVVNHSEVFFKNLSIENTVIYEVIFK